MTKAKVTPEAVRAAATKAMQATHIARWHVDAFGPDRYYRVDRELPEDGTKQHRNFQGQPFGRGVVIVLVKGPKATVATTTKGRKKLKTNQDVRATRGQPMSDGTELLMSVGMVAAHEERAVEYGWPQLDDPAGILDAY